MDYCAQGHANPSGARFCGRCGEPTATWTCANGHRVSTDRGFCDQCGVDRAPPPGSTPPPPGAVAPGVPNPDAFASPESSPPGPVPPPPVAPAGAVGPAADQSGGRKERASPALVTTVIVLAVVAALVVLVTGVRLATDGDAGDRADDEPAESLPSAAEEAWDPGFKRRTIAECMQASGLPVDDARRTCTCIFDILEEELTYSEVLEIDERLRDDPTAIPTEIEAAANQCV